MKAGKIQKGEKGCLVRQRKSAILRTAMLFILSLAVFLTGLISTGQKENLLTIVAVLGCLPASRSAVNMIMLMRFHGVSEKDYSAIAPHVQTCTSLWDMVFTSYEKNYEIHHMAFKGNALIGYTANADCDAAKCAQHLQKLCAQNGLKDVEIKIFRELPKYLNRLDQIQDFPDYEVEEQGKAPVPKRELVCALLRAVSL